MPTSTAPVIPPDLSTAERKARREARREKERALSVGRAAKMHETRLAAESNPPLILAEAAQRELPLLNAGCSGWYYWHWKGDVYPREISTTAWFNYYADRLESVELNAPFYSWPTIATVKSWIRQAGSHPIVYTVKVSELITHIKRFEDTAELVRDFGYIADILGSRMGCFLFQLPPSYDYTPSRLQDIVSQLDPLRRNVVEFRHRSWWNETVYEEFRKRGIMFCSASAPRLPDALVKTADEVYIRFHGTKQWYDHNYSPEELTHWADAVRDSGATRVWAYFNNDTHGYSFKNAAEFMQILQLQKPEKALPTAVI
ncbi:MAG: DUF72 domain-containing protein [Candidatus Methylacidiphilales bacterium]|nr:DUF72 domain-containing protein [Candidatus Methylacidiphilales bacterium]